MKRLLRFSINVWLLLLATHAHAFSLLGPLDGRFQAPAIGYDATPSGGPMNIGEEYRWTVPVITYAYDESFLNYFGASGVAAIEAAFKVFNDLPDVDTIQTFPGDPNLYVNGIPVPITTKGNNFQASALGVADLKSFTMSVLASHLGLAHAENWVWCLHDRAIATVGGFTNYSVIKRNFDPITWEPTNAVNSAVYTYTIFDGTPGADAVEAAVDPLASGNFTTVAGGSVPASRIIGLGGNLGIGQFYSGLTRDDMGGLRYMLRSGNLNLEALRGGFTNVPISSPYLPAGGGTNATNQAVINALRPGIGKVSFQRIDIDSLVNLSGVNVYTNTFTDKFITNNGVIKSQNVRLIASNPDIIIAASDLGNVIVQGVIGGPLAATDAPSPTGSFINSTLNALLYPPGTSVAAQAGPGTIGLDLATTGSGSIVFNKIGPSLVNQTPSFLTEEFSFRQFVWGSFDGSGADAILYPNGASIQTLEQNMLGH